MHSIGQKRTKYMGFPLKTAPLLDRTACAYTRDFMECPLGDRCIILFSNTSLTILI